MTTLERAQEFLTHESVALVGLSRDPKDFSRHLLRELRRRGYRVSPVNPGLDEAEGLRCVPRLQDLQPAPAWALVLVPPLAAEQVVRDAAEAGLRRIWFHRGAGRGSASAAALAECERAGLESVSDLCPFMVLPGGSFPHRLHGFFRRRALRRRELRP